MQLTGARTGEVALLRCAPGGGEKGARGDTNEPRERNVEEQGLGFRGTAHTEIQTHLEAQVELTRWREHLIHTRTFGGVGGDAKSADASKGGRGEEHGVRLKKMWVASRRSEQEPDGGLVVALAPVLLGRVLVFARLNIALPLMIRLERTAFK